VTTVTVSGITQLLDPVHYSKKRSEVLNFGLPENWILKI